MPPKRKATTEAKAEGKKKAKLVEDSSEDEKLEILKEEKKISVRAGGKKQTKLGGESSEKQQPEIAKEEKKISARAKKAKVVVEEEISEKQQQSEIVNEDKKVLARGKKAKVVEENNEEQQKPEVEKEEKEASATAERKSSNLKISSWNINGIRAWLEKKGLDFIRKEQPDMFVVQETKCSTKEIPGATKVPGYKTYWLDGDKDGYAGVGLYTKTEPISISYGLGKEEFDKDGRLITAEYPAFYLLGAYVPNSGRGLPRLGYRQKYDKEFLKYICDLDKKKPVIYCGDLNVAHEEIDLANPKTNTKNAGFTKEERADFTELLSAGYIDSYRHLYPKKRAAYTFWSYMRNARAQNIGWRLDYFVISERLKEKLVDNIIHADVMGSDHCPITLLMNM